MIFLITNGDMKLAIQVELLYADLEHDVSFNMPRILSSKTLRLAILIVFVF